MKTQAVLFGLTLAFLFSVINPDLKTIEAALFNITNNCSYTVWAAAKPGGGRELKHGQYWMMNTDPNFKDQGRIWGRTNCDFSTKSDKKCESGDCDGTLFCDTYGKNPVTLAEYTFSAYQSNDFLDISLVDGFNVPIGFYPEETKNCTKGRGPVCGADINAICPTELRDVGGCLHPCTVFGNDQFCCPTTSSCKSTEPYFKLFKDACPDAYSYAFDDEATFTCTTGTDYKVVFCPYNHSGVLSATITLTNNCPYTIWPASLVVGGPAQLETTGFELGSGGSRSINVPSPLASVRFWGRRECSTTDGRFSCKTGDCGSGQVSCNGAGGAPPTSLAEFTLDSQDFYDISLVDGFDLPITIAPQGGSGDTCGPTSCTADVNGGCPAELQLKGSDGGVIACTSACTAFNESRYCCTGSYSTPETCPPTSYSQYFEGQCPQAYSYAYDDLSSIFACNGSPNYVVTFCP